MKQPTNINLLWVGAVVALVSVGCARQSFNSAPQSSSSSTPPGPAAQRTFNLSKSIGAGKVDILIMNDNSGSMSVNQSKLAAAFGTFISALGNRDWRIAMVTSDLYAGNGRLVAFSGGQKFITPSTPNAQGLLSQAVVRQETITCEQSDYTNCPSFDERGTYTAYLALSRNEDGWLRSDATTAVVYLANEDVRSDASIYNGLAGYGLETNDRPETSVSLFDAGGMYAGKVFQAHSIIIIPNDTWCLSQQTNSRVRGYYGQIYANLSNLTTSRGWGGGIYNICASDYSGVASSIGANFVQGDRVISLPCRPQNNQVQGSWTPANSSLEVVYDPTLNQARLQVIGNPSANVPGGTTWNVRGTCE